MTLHPAGSRDRKASPNDESLKTTGLRLARLALDLETAASELESGATHHERRRAAWLVGRICDMYPDSAEDARAEIRHVLVRHEVLRAHFCDEIGRAAAALAEDPSPRRLRTGLAAAVLADRRPDERVWDTQVQALSAVRGIGGAVVDGLWQEACDLAFRSETSRALAGIDQSRRSGHVTAVSAAPHPGKPADR